MRAISRSGAFYCLDEADRALATFHAAPLPPALRAAHERSFAHWAKRGPRMFRGARCSLAPFGRRTPTNRIARDCASKSGGFAPSSNPLQT
jgi:hypothetical protein